MSDIPERRRDHQLRKTIDEYRKLASEAEEEAKKCDDPAKRAGYLKLAGSLTELADTLQGRPYRK
jgi:hypothetical protein